MRVSRSAVGAVLFMALALPSLSQANQNAPASSAEQSSPQAPAEPHSANRARLALCWKQAGIAPAAMNQRWKIQDNGKARINEVCNDPTLTPEKRRDRIGQINEETDREIAKIIPAKQLQAFKACQAEQEKGKAKRPGSKPQRELGPCGGVIPEQPSTPEHSHQH